ncbi:TauD/TfdA family dioxygenase [Moorena bouillonii]|uniref:TauD/TfdA-like domain-containing protein n=1 Tax=Moorena bouillonii PNG TaxID=568701 RepID=A0A1U7N353_9CYAN|nr:TauD/TfdA family dioxygenase [Moorena bouillonii]OLT60388.1 hypothetical protein BJP37_16525 [Moorena bouillonii PNG]
MKKTEKFPESKTLIDGHNETMDIEALSAEILKVIKVDGFVHIKQPLSQNAYQALLHLLGTIIGRTDLVVDAKLNQLQQMKRKHNINRPSVYLPEALAFHTDTPASHLIGWYCVEQDEVDGATLLLDTTDIKDYFTPAELSVLSGVNVQYMIRNPNTNEEDVVYQPLISQKNSTYQVFYVPWNLSNHHNGAQTKLLEKFSEYVVHKQRTELIKIRLAPKECLFIDNHRMLHCRGKLPENTKRHLIRYYISTCLIS